MSRHVVVFANSDYDDTPYDEWAPADVTLHLLVPEERAHGYAHLPNVRAFASYRTSGAVELAALDLARRVRPCAIIARGEVDLLRAARLRELAGIPGQGWQSALAFRDKVVMKQRLRAGGVPVPAFTVVETGLDVVEFGERHGLPMVVKPVRGSGSLGTTVIRSRDDLRRMIAGGVGAGLEVEAFVPGPMYIVDGLVRDSQVAFMRPSRYVNGCLAFRDGDFLGIRLLANDDPLYGRLTALAQRVMAGLPTPPHTTFHLEIFHTPDDRLVVCEVASRTGGARINQMIRHACGFDMDRAWFAGQLGDPAPALPNGRRHRPVGNVVIYPGTGVLASLPTDGRPRWVLDGKVAGTVGTRYDGGHKSGDFLAAYTVTAPTEDGVDARFHELARWFGERARWS